MGDTFTMLTMTTNTNRRRSTATAASAPRTGASKSTSHRASAAASEFELDPELLDDTYNQTRRPRLPSGIVINEKPSGILIPIEQLEPAGWLVMPTEEELTPRELGANQVLGLMLTQARVLVLGFVPEYIRYKDGGVLTDNGEEPTLALAVVGPYVDYQQSLNKRTMEVCSEHALVFLDEDNQPLHTTPIVVRFKNVALWSFKSAREEYYRKLEKAFAQVTGQSVRGKSDKWRSLGVLPIEFKAVKEGEGKNKSWCCKTEVLTQPNVDNFPSLFMGTPQSKGLVWGLQDEIEGFVDPPALPGAAATLSLPAAPEPEGRLRPAHPSAEDLALDDDEDTLDVEAEAIGDELDEFDDEFDEDED